MNYKKMLIVPALLLSCTNVLAQSCTDVEIESVFSGSQFGSLIRTVDRTCGNNGFICADASGDLTASASSRVFAAALTAQATGTNVDVRWDPSNGGCGNNFPTVTSLNIVTAQ